ITVSPNVNHTVSYSQNGTAVESPTNAGTYTVTVTVTDPNYTGSATGTLTIGKAASTTTVSCPTDPQPYTGSAIAPCQATVTGVGGLTQDVSTSIVYTNNTNAGTATASYSYAGDDNHTASTDSKTFTIGQGTAQVSVSDPAPTYDGTAKTATIT